jgi:hypothetical protein
MGRMRNAHKNFIVKRETQVTSSRPRCKSEANVKMYPEEIGLEGMKDSFGSTVA